MDYTKCHCLEKFQINRFFLIFIWISFPLYLEGYHLYRVTQAGAYTIAVLGLCLLIGTTGQISVGHSAFFALGAYMTAISVLKFGIPIYVSIWIGALGGLLLGFLFGWPALRLSSVNLLLATWALAIVTPKVLNLSYFESWTGGSSGLYIDEINVPFDLNISNDEWWHIVTLIYIVVVLLISHNLRFGRINRALVAVRDNPIAAETMGISANFYKTIIFGLSAAVVSVAGGLTTALTDFVSPQTYDLYFAMILVFGVFISGSNGTITAFLGGFLIEFLPDIAFAVSDNLASPQVFYGFLLLLLVYMLPEGLRGLLLRIEKILNMYFRKFR